MLSQGKMVFFKNKQLILLTTQKLHEHFSLDNHLITLQQVFYMQFPFYSTKY
jgi:hypothetical protein